MAQFALTLIQRFPPYKVNGHNIADFTAIQVSELLAEIVEIQQAEVASVSAVPWERVKHIDQYWTGIFKPEQANKHVFIISDNEMNVKTLKWKTGQLQFAGWGNAQD